MKLFKGFFSSYTHAHKKRICFFTIVLIEKKKEKKSHVSIIIMDTAAEDFGEKCLLRQCLKSW